jgi:signal peptidase I
MPHIDAEKDNILYYETAGFSMHPFVRNGDRVLVKKTKADSLRIGDIILFNDALSKNTVCHRLVNKARTENGLILLTRGDASVDLSLPVSEKDLIGKVIAVMRKGRFINLSNNYRIAFNWLIAKFYAALKKEAKKTNSFLRKLYILRNRLGDLIRFMSFLSPYYKNEALVVLLNLVAIPLGLAMPYLTKLVIDKAFVNSDFSLFLRFVFLGAALFLITALLDSFSSYLQEKIKLKVNFDINNAVFTHLQNLSLKFFRQRSTGEHIYRLSFDLESITGMITDTALEIIYFTVRFLLVAVMVFYLNWKMALVCLAAWPFLCITFYYYTPRSRDILQKRIDSSQSIFVKLQEVFSHIHLVKSFGKEKFEISDFLGRLSERMQLSLSANKLRLRSAFAGNSLMKIVMGIFSAYGGYQVIKGQMTLGSLAALLIYINQLIGLQFSLGGFLQRLTYDFVTCDRIKEILDSKPDILDKPGALDVKFEEKDIKFENITFRYGDEPVLKNLSFSIKGCSSIALVGHSGRGKTTIINLLLRLYEPQKGRILIAGYDIRDLKTACIKGQIGVALQEPFLWNDSIENDIKYGMQNASFAQVVESAKISGADDFIMKLPAAYKTKIGENAALISQGQKQRIAIARAIIKNPAIIIFDEAMSSLDSESEDRIIEMIKNRYKSSTIITITHRLSAVKKMDSSFFLESTDKIDVGSHDELLARNSKYRELFSGQI